jgi:hypothetical protein
MELRHDTLHQFLIDAGIGEASNWRVAQRSSTEGIDPLAPATQTVTGDSEKSGSRSFGDRQS